MTQPAPDPRAVTEYRIPATALLAGDLVNTSPGGEDDWQQVLSVHTAEAPGEDAEATSLIAEIGDRYVMVRLTDVAPVDSPVYFENGTALAFGLDGAEDGPVTDVLSDPNSVRTFLYTRFELVTVRA
ncbi:hypothetical protein [Jatrophihabitans lederbergiae]|jgi:hypothetical protein|uniref:Uncharacterized protein n=1 Tax=Jatrophihabitans lederbergiae TaxID=3075547 RepID=A0ABU2J7B5_9ACTN|nr:hypothetical protein [Jatrophihabitans sp. DSM 44399]MDT0260389.1 hypothetical protein [Jatrophihabitans sp. DSM 44399]